MGGRLIQDYPPIDKKYDFIHQFMDNRVLILISPYSSTFYINRYLDEMPQPHGIIICGYHFEKSIVILRDNMIVDKKSEINVNKYFQSNPLFMMRLKEEHLLDIWNSRNKYYKNDKTLVNILYSIERIGDAKVNSYEDMLFDIITNYNYENDAIIKSINNFNNNKNKIKTDAVNFRRQLYGRIELFFRGIEMGLNQNNINDNKFLNYFYQFKKEYMDMRDKICVMMFTYSYRDKDIDQKKINDMVSKMQQLNIELMQLTKDSYEIIKKYSGSIKNNIQLINYALGAKASADSEFIIKYINFMDSASKSNFVNFASNAVNGEWSDKLLHRWRSNVEDTAHWLKVDLLNPRKIKIFVIRHDSYEQNDITKDFQIQGSNDDKNWNVLVSVTENNEITTTHKVNLSVGYRYFRPKTSV